MHTRSRGYAGFAVTVALTACTAEASPSLSIETDSAGVRIVTSSAPAAEWSLSAEPVLSLGENAADEATEFFRVRAIAFLPGDRIAIANQGTETIRFFTTEGAFIGEAGGEGAGPGELSFLSWLAVRGDSLLSYDDRNDRVSVWDLSGAFARTFRLEPSSGPPKPAFVSQDGSIVAVTARQLGQLTTQGLVLDSALITRHDPTGALRDSLPRFPHNQRVVRTAGNVSSAMMLPYSVVGDVAAASEGLCYTFGSVPQLTCLQDDGTPALLVRTAAVPRPITTEHKESYWVREIELAGENEMRVRTLGAMRQNGTFPESFPAFADLLADDLGRVWARVFPLPDSDRTEWQVFEEGRWVGRLLVDPAFEILAVSGGRAAGIWRDPLGVESVRVHGIDTQAR